MLMSLNKFRTRTTSYVKLAVGVPCRLSSPRGLIDVVSLEQAGGGTSPARGGDDP